jgi:benzoate membrane transport protein
VNAAGHLRSFHPAAGWAGLTAGLWYAFGAVPLHIAVAAQLGLDSAQTASWIFVVWFSGAISSIVLSLVYRQPIPITSSIPGLVYLGTLAGQFSFPEIVGANLLAGLLILGLGVLGIGGRVLVWLPLPLAMGMFAGSILGNVTGLVRAAVEDVVVAGAAVAGYLLGRCLGSPRIPPVGLAIVCGGLAIALTQRATLAPAAWNLPTLVVPEMRPSLAAFVGVSLPLVVLAIGLGNVQGLGFLIVQGYRVPVNLVTVVVGLNSIVNAMLGGHTAIVGRTGVAILASSEAGPPGGRYWGNLTAATLMVLIALAAGPIATLLGVLPRTFIVAVAGLAILSPFQEALVKGFDGPLRFGAIVAFIVAATPFEFAGITSAFWALVAGLLASLLTERKELLAYWRGKRAAPEM